MDGSEEDEVPGYVDLNVPFPLCPPQIDVLQAEVQALKTLVLSSPTSPVGELPSGGVKTPFRKGHSRNKSTSSAIMGTQPDPSATQPIVRECREVGGDRHMSFI